MHRFFIVVPIYAAVVILLPRQDWFLPFADYLARIDSETSFWASMALSAAALLGVWVIRSRPLSWMMRRPRVTEVIWMGCLGVLVAGIFDLFEWLSNTPVTLMTMTLMPIGFMISEAIFLAIQWRMSRGRDQEQE